jgi:hypothetical protein
MTTTPQYQLVDRNIHLVAGKYRVLITRRPKNIYGGRFETLAEAVAVRDQLQQQHAPRKPWGIRGHIVECRRTTQSLRDERLAAGLCQMCGENPPKTGLKACSECCNWQNQKRMFARRQSSQLQPA